MEDLARPSIPLVRLMRDATSHLKKRSLIPRPKAKSEADSRGNRSQSQPEALKFQGSWKNHEWIAPALRFVRASHLKLFQR